MGVSADIRRKKNNYDTLNFMCSLLLRRHPVMAKWPVGHNWFFMKLDLIQAWLQDWVGGVSLVPLEDYFKATPFWDSILLFYCICIVKRITKSVFAVCSLTFNCHVETFIVFFVWLKNVIMSLSLAKFNMSRQRQPADENVLHFVLLITFHLIAHWLLFAKINECIRTTLFINACCHFSH